MVKLKTDYIKKEENVMLNLDGLRRETMLLILEEGVLPTAYHHLYCTNVYVRVLQTACRHLYCTNGEQLETLVLF